MNSRFCRVCSMVSMVALSAVAGLAWAPAQPPSDPPPPPAQGDPRTTERRPDARPGQEGGPRQPGAQRRENVEGLMKTMNRSMKALRGQLDDATKKDENLRLIGEMQRVCVTAKAAGLPGDVLRRAAKTDEDKAKVTDAYRKHLIAATRKLLDIEDDIAAGKAEAAGKKLDELVEMRKKSHDELGVKDD